MDTSSMNNQELRAAIENCRRALRTGITGHKASSKIMDEMGKYQTELNRRKK